MRIKTFLIATLIIGAMTFPFRHNAMPVFTHSASPATLTATAAAAQGINPLASYDFVITDFNPYSLLYGRNVLPGATHSAFPATLTAAAAVPDFPVDGSGERDARVMDANGQYALLSRGGIPSQAEMFYKTNYCDEAWEFRSTNPFNPQGPDQIRHSNTQTCLEVQGYANGAIAVQAACNAQSAAQLWYTIPVYDHPELGGDYLFRNVNSGKYLCHGGLAPVRQYSYSGYANHPTTYRWQVFFWDGKKDSTGKCVRPN